MIYDWDSYVGTLATNYPDVNYGVFPTPAFSEETPFAYDRYNGESTPGINFHQSDEQKAVAQDFIRFILANDDYMRIVSDVLNSFPGKKSLQDDPEILDNPMMAAIAPRLDRLIWPGPTPSTLETSPQIAFENVLQKGQDVDSAVAYSQELIMSDMEDSDFTSMESRYAHYDERKDEGGTHIMTNVNRSAARAAQPASGEVSGARQVLGRIFTMRNIAVVSLVVYFAVFMAYPIFSAFAGSLHDWNPLIDKYDWVGFDNFVNVLTDGLFWKSLWNTAIYSFFSILFRVVLGLALALLLSSKLVKCKDTLRGLFYMPTITPLVAVSFVWMWMFDPQFGMIDKITGLDISWLNDSRYAMPAVIIMTIWKDFGYATVLYLAGIMALPRDVYEAAQIDGANW